MSLQRLFSLHGTKQMQHLVPASHIMEWGGSESTHYHGAVLAHDVVASVR